MILENRFFSFRRVDKKARVTGTVSLLYRSFTYDGRRTPHELTLSGEQIPTKAIYMYLHISVFIKYNFLCFNALNFLCNRPGQPYIAFLILFIDKIPPTALT